MISPKSLELRFSSHRSYFRRLTKSLFKNKETDLETREPEVREDADSCPRVKTRSCSTALLSNEALCFGEDEYFMTRS